MTQKREEPMRFLQPVVLFSLSCVLAIAACTADPDDYQSLEDLEEQSSAETSSSAEDESVDVEQYGNDPATATLPEADEGLLANCPPPGTWSQTCLNSSCEGSVLCAECLDGQGGAPRSCINVASCGAVANCNGQLCC
jgi:hypothetical protein